MRHLLWAAVAIAMLAACGQSYEETKRKSRAERIRLAREDSAAFKVAVMPTIDCLPLWVARSYGLFDTLGVDIRLKWYNAQMDCDTALARKRVEASVSDIVRAMRLEAQGTPLSYPISTDAYWLLITNKNSRIKELKQLDDKMIAMTRFSITDMLADRAIDSAKLKAERVFKIQINDVNIRLQMLRNNEMDALFLAEPQATAALLEKHRSIMDSRKLDYRMGVIALRKDIEADTARRKQIDAFIKAYDMAVDSINKHGIGKYADMISQYCHVSKNTVDSLSKAKTRYRHAAAPRQKDMETARKWATGKGNDKND